MKFFFLRADVANYFFSRSFFPTDVLALLLYWKKVSFCVESRIIVISLLPFPGTRQTTEAEFCLFAFCAITRGAIECAFVRQLTRKEALHSSLSMKPVFFGFFLLTHTRRNCTQKRFFWIGKIHSPASPPGDKERTVFERAPYSSSLRETEKGG